MALWQFDIVLFPRPDNPEFEYHPKTLEDLEAPEADAAWGNISLDQTVREIIERADVTVLEASKRDIGLGAYDKNFVGISVSDHKILEIVVRFDLSDNDYTFTNGILEFARLRDLLIYSIETSRVIEPELKLLIAEFERSRARRFLKHSHRFLDDEGAKIEIDEENRIVTGW